MAEEWSSTFSIEPKEYICGYCEKLVGSNLGYRRNFEIPFGHSVIQEKDFIYICPFCKRPTYFTHNNIQTPSPTYGKTIKIDTAKDVETLYNEARNCFKVKAFTASILCCRKLLMHIAVSKGAEEEKSFLEYINFLSEKGYVPPDGKEWVDQIRKKGNEANHEIVIMGKEDATELIVKS